MRTVCLGLYTGISIGTLYYAVELIWNFIFSSGYQNFRSFVIGWIIYTVFYSAIGAIFSLLMEITNFGKSRLKNAWIVHCFWVYTIISACFLGSMYLLPRVLYVYSGLTKAAVTVTFCILATTGCYLVYYFTDKIAAHDKRQWTSFHYTVLVLFNIFIILVIKANTELRTQPWSLSNLMWDFVIFLGLLSIGTLYQFSSHFSRSKTKKMMTKTSAVLICVGILWLLLANINSKKAIGNENTGKQYVNTQNIPPVILITLDTVRADHLSSYGYNMITSPSIDKFANDGTRFNNAICQVPLTRPSHFSILTGRYPYSHGLLENFSVTPEGIPLLSEELSDNKFNTAAFVSSTVLNSSFNTKFGFQQYHDKIVNVTFDSNFLMIMNLRHLGFIEIKAENSAAETNQKVFNWLEEHSDQLFFIWIHYFDPHTPYEPSNEYRKLFTDQNYDIKYLYDYQWERDNYDPKSKTVQISKDIIQYAAALYNAEIRYLDYNVGLLLKKLKALNLYDKSLIILTADHGESFEHDYYFDHGDRLYDSLIRVPLIIKFPSNKWEGRTIEDQIETIDIAPTILNFLGLNPFEGIEGRSLMGLISGTETTGEIQNEYSFAQSPYRGGFYFKAKELRCIRTNQWKYIVDLKTGQQELYEISNDSKEQKNLIGTHTTVLDKFHSVFDKLNKNVSIDKRNQQMIELDDATLEKFKSLGYTR